MRAVCLQRAPNPSCVQFDNKLNHRHGMTSSGVIKAGLFFAVGSMVDTWPGSQKAFRLRSENTFDVDLKTLDFSKATVLKQTVRDSKK